MSDITKNLKFKIIRIGIIPPYPEFPISHVVVAAGQTGHKLENTDSLRWEKLSRKSRLENTDSHHSINIRVKLFFVFFIIDEERKK